MVTKEQAMSCNLFHHIKLNNADGTPLRARANGACKVWKTRPAEFRLPVKHGLRMCFYITQANADQWVAVESVRDKQARELGLSKDVPDCVLHDALAGGMEDSLSLRRRQWE